MDKNIIPKWERELKSFAGIKSGIVLEGNVYDEFPLFEEKDGQAEFLCTDNMDNAIMNLTGSDTADVFFFDPVDGFYTYSYQGDEAKNALQRLLSGYNITENFRDHKSTLCVMPSGKKGCSSQEGSAYIWMSEIIKRAVSDKKDFTDRENIIFVLNFASRLDACNLRESEANTMFLNLMAATTAMQTEGLLYNSVIMVVDKYNDIPAWLYINNPNVRNISVCMPDRDIRKLYLENLYPGLEEFGVLSDPGNEAGKKFIAGTEGMKLKEIFQILRLAKKMNIPPEDINTAFRLYKYGISENPWENLDDSIVADINKKLEERVKGQDAALKKVKTVILRAVKGLSGLQHSGASHKPKGILFFAGPTGVGKTETAKALAEAIFGDENACIRFDMSEYRLEHSDQKLFGAPPGYVGYEGGGQLTNAVKNRPFSVLLFDEIEKASPTILDKFLQILEDGRMTDNQGNTVYFGETVIIFTSNIGLTREVPDPDDPFGRQLTRVPSISIIDPEKEDTDEFRARVTELLTKGVKDYFTENGRPELLNRLGDDNIVVFQFISKEAAKTICGYKLEKIVKTIKTEKNIDIDVSAVRELLDKFAVLERGSGGRGVGNMLEREFLNPLAEFICTLSFKPAALRCSVKNDSVEFEVI